jgi:Transglycosylase
MLRGLGRFLAYLVMLFLCLDLAAETYFICLNWVNPPITMYMLEGGGETLDAVLAEQLVHAVSRQRVLELYLNEAQFGPNIYGICDAAWYYFNDPPDYMSLKDAYELMGVLPGPDHAHRLRTGGIDISRSTSDGRFERYYIQGAEYWVPRDLQVDGGSDDV